MKFSNLLFDLDGTLIDSKRGIFNAVRYTLDYLKIPEDARPKDLNPFIGPPLRDSFIDLFNFSKEAAEFATIKYREYYSKQGLFEFDVYEGIPEALNELLKVGFSLSVVTSKAEEYAKRIIQSTSFSHCFESISGCEIDGRRSSKHELILYSLKKLNVIQSPEVLMIGDRYHDIRGAKLAAISSGAVLYGYGSKEELIDETPTLFINSPTDLLLLQKK